ncbi:predicted protein [Lichtheimia corymbifera JMRC:FSU:9682]|uniref:Uncharacterized protein n=1 Tax=Lichtheimia corymbifera JMRC:FSU:9682 TaxID=1263082 RepID=A0A068S814_9FUNG|nr:predicted protein [Lichtheimia corymbifera JMRC:FSU:9682]
MSNRLPLTIQLQESQQHLLWQPSVSSSTNTHHQHYQTTTRGSVFGCQVIHQVQCPKAYIIHQCYVSCLIWYLATQHVMQYGHLYFNMLMDT